MVSVLQKINLNDTPRFVIHDLSHLPPIDMISLDVSSMAQQIKSLKSNISNANMITGLFKEMESVKSSIEALNLQMADLIVSINQSKKKEKPERDLPCSVWNIDTRLEVVKQKPENKVMVPVSSALKRSSCMNGDAVSNEANSESSVVISDFQSEGKPNSHEQGRVENGKAETKENQFKLVVSRNKRRPKKVIYGTSGTGGHQLRIQNRRLSIFLSRLMPDMEEEEVKQYVNSEFLVDFTCEKLQTRYDSYSSFKVEGFCDNVDMFYDASKWPKGVLVRKYFTPRKQ